MPILSVFFGIVIRIYHLDHNPPHIHVQYGEYEATMDIRARRVLQGQLPKRVLRLVLEWLDVRRTEVEQAWKAVQMMKNPKRIKPLE